MPKPKPGEVKLSRGPSTLHFRGTFTYLVIHSTVAGRKRVYDVFIPTASEPLLIGRELPLKIVRSLIFEMEEAGPKPWYGSLHDARLTFRIVLKARQEKYGS